jgi:hypothetical protein
MRHIFQDNLTVGEGNCFAACVASILELPLAEVPNFCAAAAGTGWWPGFQHWLGERGLYAIGVKLGAGRPAMSPAAFGVPCILTGTSPRGDWRHSVVAFTAVGGFEFDHDPNPNHDGRWPHDITEVTFLACLNVKRCLHRQRTTDAAVDVLIEE